MENKPTRLYSNILLIIAMMQRTMTPALKRQFTGEHLVDVVWDDMSQTFKITGKRGMEGLKGSQTYTREY